MRNVAGNLIKEQFAKQAEGYSGYFSFDQVRPYFDIDNMFILKKLKLIFLPFLQKGDWKTENKEDYMGSARRDFDYANQYEQSVDPYGVDLYLPIMSLITYTLIVGFHDGALEIFDPASLSYTVGNWLAIWVLESIAIKLIFAIQGVQNWFFLDILWVSGYKFVSLIVLYLSLIFGSSWTYYPALIFIGITMSVFVIKTLKRFTHFNISSQFISQETMTKTTMLYIIGAFQIPLLFLLGLW